MVRKKQKVESVMVEQNEEKSEILVENLELDSEVVDENSEEKTLPNESKEAKFIRLAQKRMSRLLYLLKSVSKLSNRNNYLYNNKQVEQMFVALEDNIRIAKAKFSEIKVEKPEFIF